MTIKYRLVTRIGREQGYIHTLYCNGKKLSLGFASFVTGNIMEQQASEHKRILERNPKINELEFILQI